MGVYSRQSTPDSKRSQMTPEHATGPSISAHDRHVERLRTGKQRPSRSRLCYTCGQPNHTAQSCPNSQPPTTQFSQPLSRPAMSITSSTLHATPQPVHNIPPPNLNQVQATTNPAYFSSNTLPPPQTSMISNTHSSSNTLLSILTQPLSSTNTPTYNPSQFTPHQLQAQPYTSPLLSLHASQPESIEEQISKLKRPASTSSATTGRPAQSISNPGEILAQVKPIS